MLTRARETSSAKDQLTGQHVAVKKINKPFSTAVLAKRTYRELKLLKHLRHENLISLSDIFISPLEDMYVNLKPRSDSPVPLTHSPSYFVTELLQTDLHRLLTSRPLEKQFIQYFLYQLLVSAHGRLPTMVGMTSCIFSVPKGITKQTTTKQIPRTKTGSTRNETQESVSC